MAIGSIPSDVTSGDNIEAATTNAMLAVLRDVAGRNGPVEFEDAIVFRSFTTSERDAVSSPLAGMTIWNSTTSQIEHWNGSSWESGDGGQPDAFNALGFVGATSTLLATRVNGEDPTSIPLDGLNQYQGHNVTEETTFGRGDYASVENNLYFLIGSDAVTLTNPNTELPSDARFYNLPTFTLVVDEAAALAATVVANTFYYWNE